MVTIEKVDVFDKAQVNRFIQIPFRLYKNCSQWVPPILGDAKVQLDPNKHPYYEHSDAEFFIARRDGADVGRIAALHNKPFNQVHGTKEAEFYLFESEDDQEVADALVNRVFEWAKARGMTRLVGPKGFSPFDGYGIQIEGFQHRQMMTMMNYNYEYYVRLVEHLGFAKEVDFVSRYLSRESFVLPERVKLIAQKVQERGTFKVINFNTKKELKAWVPRVGKAYNDTFIHNWEYYPLTEKEVNFAFENLLMIADPHLIKVITHNDNVVGFVLGFPDISAALQRAKGKINPISIADLLLETKRTKWLELNGAGVLPEFQGRGGNALMYSEMEKTLQSYGYLHAELTNVAETTKQMRADLLNVGSQPYKNHRVYQKVI